MPIQRTRNRTHVSWRKMRKIQSLEAYIFAAKIILSSKYKYLYIIYKYILYRRKKLNLVSTRERKTRITQE